MRPVLGIETSCDETAAAVLDADGRVLAEAVLSQEREHAPYGGVVPEIAARAHLAFLPDLVRRVMAQAGLGFADLGGVAASGGPGLIGGLIVGSQFAKGVALAHRAAVRRGEPSGGARADRPAARPGDGRRGISLPAAAGLRRPLPVRRGRRASGATCRLGGTIDDAAGEAFDKVGKLLGLRWPGGPALESLAASGDPGALRASRARCSAAPGCDFSFSGLKTAVRTARGRGTRHGPLASARRGRHRRQLPSTRSAEVLADRAAHAMAMMRSGHPRRACWWSPAASRPTARSARRFQEPPRRRSSTGRAAGPAVHRQCGDGGLGRDRAAAARAGR